jgi:hypothetical protein
MFGEASFKPTFGPLVPLKKCRRNTVDDFDVSGFKRIRIHDRRKTIKRHVFAPSRRQRPAINLVGVRSDEATTPRFLPGETRLAGAPPVSSSRLDNAFSPRANALQNKHSLHDWRDAGDEDDDDDEAEDDAESELDDAAAAAHHQRNPYYERTEDHHRYGQRALDSAFFPQKADEQETERTASGGKQEMGWKDLYSNLRRRAGTEARVLQDHERAALYGEERARRIQREIDGTYGWATDAQEMQLGTSQQCKLP